MKSLLTLFQETCHTFEGIEHDEKVLLLIRRHPFYIIIKIAVFIIIIVAPLLVGSSLASYIVTNGLLELSLFVYSIWCLLLWLSLFYSITMYALDVWIVTDRRIIDSTQHGFFNRSVSELHLTRIQDISVKVDGLVQTFFTFGDLDVQTAGTENKFNFSQIPNPNEVKDQIMSHTFSGTNTTDKSVVL